MTRLRNMPIAMQQISVWSVSRCRNCSALGQRPRRLACSASHFLVDDWRTLPASKSNSRAWFCNKMWSRPQTLNRI